MDWIMGLIVLIAYFVKGMCGFANTLIISTLMSFRADNIAISPIDLVLGGPANILIAWRERASVRLRVWLPLAAMVVLGTLPGIFFLKVGDAGLIKALLG
ncbi:MAG: sulfite exporter TauE/SafE family protein, partial [Eubacteriales bacterium]|nr:sulfite exporter TauE/SafE family protein [Eubacteriales bacterium]